MTTTNFPNGITSFGVPVLGGGSILPFTGNYWFVDPARGLDGNDGSAASPLATLPQAYANCIDDHDDVVFLVGSTTTNRLSATLTWAKNNTHLVGLTAPTQIGQRARISNLSTAFPNPMVRVTAQACMFLNLCAFMGYVTPTAGVLWSDGGQRNYYGNVNFQAFGSTQQSGDTGSRSLLINGAGENTLEGCTFGVDTIVRSVANANVEFAGATTRNTFKRCTWMLDTSSADALGILVAAAEGIDRWVHLDNCTMINVLKSGSIACTGFAKLAASAGGLILVSSPTLVGFTSLGYDATSKAQIYVNGAVPTGATSGIAVNPT